MSAKDKKLIMVTIAVVLIAAVLILLDNSTFLVKRTNEFELPEDAEIVAVNKHGFIAFRMAYEAKIKVDHDDPWATVELLENSCPVQGEVIPYDNYMTTAEELFAGYKLVPAPEEESNVWIGAYTDIDDHEYVYILDSEGPEDAYLYIYYTR